MIFLTLLCLFLLDENSDDPSSEVDRVSSAADDEDDDGKLKLECVFHLNRLVQKPLMSIFLSLRNLQKTVQAF